MIEITESSTHIMQVKDDFKIKQVKKSEIVDFGVDMNRGLKILFTTKDKDGAGAIAVMHFSNGDQFDKAVGDLIVITDKMGI